MPAANTTRAYGTVAKTFHWLIALLVLTLIPLGIVANGAPFETSEELTRKAWLFSLHKTLGVTVFFVALTRILWALTQPKPGSLHPDRRAEHMLAETVHWLLYGSLLLVPLSGWVHHASTEGFAPIWWPLGQNLPLVPESDAVAAATAGLHMVLERVLVVSIVLHVAGALRHHLIDRDATLRRMWFGRTDLPNVAPHRTRSLPVIAALTVWCVAVGLGGMLGYYEAHAADRPQAAALEDVASEWVVENGELAIVVTQLGNPVRGSFDDWTADIAFDPEVQEGRAGNVEVTVSIPSLTLGSVTNEALGADFFAAEAHPTATFAAEIVALADGYEARGTLTLKGTEAPVTLPFSLTLEGGRAVMTGSTVLQRLDFGIGQSMPDASNVGLQVDVEVALTATRPEE